MGTPAIILGLDLSSCAPIEAVPESGACWLHLDRTDAEAQRWTLERSGVPEAAARALLADETRPRVDVFNGGVLLNFRGANLNPDIDEQTIVVRAWIEPGRLLTYEKHPIMAVRDVASWMGSRGKATTPAEIVVRITARMVERMEPMIDDLDARLYALEDQAIDPDVTVDRRALATLQREIISLRRYLAPQREAMQKLASGETVAFEKKDLVRVREAANHLARLYEDLSAAHERAQAAQQEAVAQLEEAQNKRLYAFTLVTIVFLPLSFLTGVFGMNVGGLPWTGTTQGFLLVCVLMVVLAVAAVWWMVWRRWV